MTKAENDFKAYLGFFILAVLGILYFMGFFKKSNKEKDSEYIPKENEKSVKINKLFSDYLESANVLCNLRIAKENVLSDNSVNNTKILDMDKEIETNRLNTVEKGLEHSSNFADLIDNNPDIAMKHLNNMLEKIKKNLDNDKKYSDKTKLNEGKLIETKYKDFYAIYTVSYEKLLKKNPLLIHKFKKNPNSVVGNKSKAFDITSIENAMIKCQIEKSFDGCKAFSFNDGKMLLYANNTGIVGSSESGIDVYTWD